MPSLAGLDLLTHTYPALPCRAFAFRRFAAGPNIARKIFSVPLCLCGE
jgi:hypothetical protein